MTLLAVSPAMLTSQIHKSLEVTEHILSNGLTVWLNEDHTQPKIFGAVVVKAGAKDSPNTGIAHYFEHIMFKGTDKIGTIDYESEKVYLDSIAAKYDELGAQQDPKKREAIQKEINELSLKAADYVIPNEFNRLISRYGGTQLNAGTSYDYTVYMNTFSPSYFAQWAELNSERLIHPVFRMFQNELETVYEEKNMYHDFIGRDAVDKLMERYFLPHPYAYPILGSTESLKNPSLTEMQQFFEAYYVASNMGVILSGDFSTEEVLPILEKTFSRIRTGEAPKKEVVELPAFAGEERFTVKFPIPIVNVAGLGFRGVPANHPDQVALNIVMGLLNNSNGTGYLDKLMVDRKLMAAMTVNENLNDAGILAVIGIPKLVFQTRTQAKELLWREINRIKDGDFTDEMFKSLKLEQKRKYMSRLEDISSCAEAMVTLFSQGKEWEEYLREIERIDSLNRDDIIRTAQKYFTENYLYVNKSTGKYPKDNLPKPGFKPIVPRHAEAVSAYAETLEELPVKEMQPRFLDLQKDAVRTELSPYAVLYATPNPVNDIFTLDIAYGVGRWEKPVVSQLAAYLPLLGTESLSFDQFRGKLQELGSTLTFDAGDDCFVVRISGFDPQFRETLELVSVFLREAKPDDKKLKQLVDEEKIMRKAFFKSTDNLAHALMEKVKYGDQSTYLNKLSLNEIKKLKGKDLIKAFREVQKVGCEFYYCGTMEAVTVASELTTVLPVNQIKKACKGPVYRALSDQKEPTVYLYHTSDAAQCIIYGYVKGEPVPDMTDRYISKLFSGYFGGDMSSLMFQEIREFRSFAYRTSARYKLPPFLLGNEPGEMTTLLSTQADKTLDALTVLDSLIRKMPVKPERINAVKQTIINHAVNNYPSFRKIPEKVASLLEEGYREDPNKGLVESMDQLGMDDVVRFYEEQISNRPVSYIIVGNTKKFDLKKLAAFGKIIKVGKEEIYH